jgi:sulfur carrier protein ThiS adenylyltransferase
LVVDRYRPKIETGEAVFCCVDSIDVRSNIWRTIKDRCRIWIDGRMLAESMRILVASNPAERAHYETTLFPGSEAATGRCTARTTIYSANVAAGMILHQFARWLRGQPTDADVSFNMFANEITVTDPEEAVIS